MRFTALQNRLKMFGNNLSVHRNNVSFQINKNKIFTKPKTISMHHLSVTCGLCKRPSATECASVTLVLGDQATVHWARKRFRCKQCRAHSKIPFQVICKGNSEIALEGRRTVLLDLRCLPRATP